mgnify:CR=1 FL=1
MQKEYLSTLMEDLKKLVTSETVVGEPIIVNSVTILPVVSVTFGFGSGGNEATSAETAKGLPGIGAGGGAKIVPIAFLVINGDQVSLLQIQHNRANTSLDRFIDLMPGIMDKVSNQFMKKKNNLTESVQEAAVHVIQDEQK